jgi:hypothetical protein
MREASVLQDTRMKPLANQSKQHSISYPTLQKSPEMAMVDRVKELSNVHIQDPAASHRHRLSPQGRDFAEPRLTNRKLAIPCKKPSGTWNWQPGNGTPAEMIEQFEANLRQLMAIPRT